MGACISQDELDKSVNKFGTKTGVGNDVPQLYCGYIYAASQKLYGPASGIESVYYETKATTKNGSTQHDQKSMIKYHSLETKQIDFVISDNTSNPLSSWIYVPASFFAAKVNGAKVHPMRSMNETAVFPSNVENLVQQRSHNETLAANDPHSLTWSLNNKQLVFSDELLEVGQQVAILGIIREITLFSGDVVRVLTPVSSVNMTDQFYKLNNWSTADKERFNDITGSTPTFLISGKNQHFTSSSIVSPRGSTTSVTFPGLEEVRSTYKAKYLPFYVEPAGGNTQSTMFDHGTSESNLELESLDRMNSFPAVNNNNHIQNNAINNTTTSASTTSGGNGGGNTAVVNTDGSGRTFHQPYKPLPKEHRNNQQDVEDTFRTKRHV